MRPRLLDLFCGAGGAAMGYSRAGFDVVGVDIKPQPHYPFEFHQADALIFPLDGFDAVHASPPCERYSMACRNFGGWEKHPDLIPPTRERLTASGLPWVIENVPGAPLRPDIRLCGCMFGLQVRRDRWFETSWRAFALRPPCHHVGLGITISGHGSTSWQRSRGINVGADGYRKAMGMPWATRDEISLAIPPAYTEHIGGFLLDHLRTGAAAS